VDINTSDTSIPTHNQISGLVTRARAHQLNNQVSSFLASYSSYLDNGNVYSVLLLRNDGQERNGVAFAPVTFRLKVDSTSFPKSICTPESKSILGRAGDIRIPEQQQIVMAAPTTYGLGFRRAITFWKARGVYFHMHQTSSPYHVRVGRNHYFGAEIFFYQQSNQQD
jgi:hypothetical protein